jgi:hypothetical protein
MADNPYLMDEKNIPPNWSPVETPGRAPVGAPAPPVPHDMPQFFSGSMPPALQHDVSFVGTEVGTPRIPKYSLMPFGNQANPFTNAAAASTSAGTTPAPTPASPDVEAIQVNQQSGTIYTAQLSDRETVISLSNNAGGVITLPPVLAAPTDAFAVATNSSTTVSVSATPSSANDFALLFTATDGLVGGTTFDPGAPWNAVAGVPSSGTVFDQQLSSPSLVTATGIISPGMSWSTSLVLFHSNGAASVVNQQVLTSGSFHSGSAALPTTTAGNTLVVVLLDVVPSAHSFNLPAFATLTDTQGNTYLPINNIGNVLGNGSAVAVAYASNIKGGADTVSFTLTGGTNGMSGSVICFEISGIITPTPLPSLPVGWFTYIQNRSTGTFIVQSGATIDGSPSPITLPPNQGVLVVTDGFNWFTVRGMFPVPVPVIDGGTGLTSLTAHNVMLGEGTSPVGFAAPGAAGTVLMSTGLTTDPAFLAIYYQIIQQAGSSKPQEPKLNFLSPITATDNSGNTSTDIAVSVFIGDSGSGGVKGLVPAPAAGDAAAGKFLKADGTWEVVASSVAAAVKINSVGVSIDKQFYFNGVVDVVAVWGVKINGVSDGG